MNITYEVIMDKIKYVNSNELMGLGRFKKREHLADCLFAMFCIANKPKPVQSKPLFDNEVAEKQEKQQKFVQLTYDRIFETIVMVENNDLMGAGHFTKDQHLAEQLFALFKLAAANEVNAVTAPSHLGAKGAALTGTRAQPKQQAQQPQQTQQPLNLDEASFA
jgi:hypothetical protein